MGLEKLEFTEQQVSVMQKELEELQPNLIKTVAETEALMAKVSKEKTEVVEPKKSIVDAEVAKAEESAAAANAIKMECQAALAVAMPVLESALCASSQPVVRALSPVPSPSLVPIVFYALGMHLHLRLS